ncbi:chymotrypsin-like elastase family member 3B [Leptodactylus fuscus]|uniref:chymotrypsin-like elastase family member 3B n=1 Tax=Leptodactylus fuscus TaxID=238119 RepID=UPI003F4EB73B
MLRLLVTVLLAAAASHGCGVPTYMPISRVVNGVDAVPHSWPWMASLQFHYYGESIHNCGGSLITSQWVLSAAHCFDYKRDYHVVLGEHDRSVEEGTEQYFPISDKDIFVHPKWNSDCPQCGYDIALIKLSREAELNDVVQPGCLPPQGRLFSSGLECFGPGWGLLYGNGPQALVLQQALLPIVDPAQCTQPDWWGDMVDESLLCAGGYDQGSCSSDSGGPLNCQDMDGRWYIEGIVSFGSARCNTLRKPTVFTRVSLFTDWIDEIITKN